MELRFGKITTHLLLVAAASVAVVPGAGATGDSLYPLDPIQNFVVKELQEASENPTQNSISLTIGTICPAGVITDTDFQNRCNEVAGSAINKDPSASPTLQAMAPEEDSVVSSVQADAGSAQIDNVSDRLSALRGGTAGGLTYRQNSGFNWAAGAAGDSASPWGFFVNGLYVNSDRDTTSRESGFDSDDWGVTGGIDYAFSEKLVVGVAFGYKNSDTDIKQNGGKVDTDSYSYLAYWSIYPDEFWYVDAIAGYTNNDHDQVRNINYTVTGFGGTTTVANSAVSSTDSDEISVSVTAGRNFMADAWTLSPYGRIDFADISIDGFNERMSQTAANGSGLAVQIDDQDFTSLAMSIGASATTTWADRYFPRVSIEYVHEFKNNNDPTTGRFINDASRTTFFLLTDKPDRNYMNLSAGLTAMLTDNVSGYFNYQGLFGYKDLDVNAFEFGIRVGF